MMQERREDVAGFFTHRASFTPSSGPQKSICLIDKKDETFSGRVCPCKELVKLVDRIFAKWAHITARHDCIVEA